MRKLLIAWTACASLVLLAAPFGVCAETVVVEASKDNTLYESSSGVTSNGAGDYIFSGAVNNGALRRAIFAFPVADSIPSGATIVSAALTLYMSKTIAGPVENTLHRVLTDWGEGDSDAPEQEGAGAPAQPGDATWIHTTFDTDFWTNPGGDFVSAPSAGQTVAGNGFYTWSDSAMVADVQGWLDEPGTNFGWILRGGETSPPSAKRFNSRTHENPDRQPTLEIEFTPPVPVDRTTWGQIKAVYGQ